MFEVWLEEYPTTAFGKLIDIILPAEAVSASVFAQARQRSWPAAIVVTQRNDELPWAHHSLKFPRCSTIPR